MRVILAVRGDNFTALSMLLSLRVKGHGPTAVAREVALELADGVFSPNLVAHVPGVANETADALSRRKDPEKSPWRLPTVLQGVPRTAVPKRDSFDYLARK